MARQTTTVNQPQPDPAEVRKGIEAFCRLLRDIKALPEVAQRLDAVSNEVDRIMLKVRDTLREETSHG